MKPDHRDRSLETSGVQDSASFEIASEESAHLMVILRDTLYSDKIAAVEREYFANAWDANRSVGKGDVPVVVRLPSPEEPVFSIRDNGPGISKADIFNVFVRYGKSTKRDDNNSVGMLGIGSKSGFAYSDSFTVTSWNGGWKRIYAAVLDSSDKGTMNMLFEEECGEETGLLIEIPVSAGDINDFREKAKILYRHVQPAPDINTDLDRPRGETILENGVIYAPEEGEWGAKTWTAVMGCVPYRIDLTKVPELSGHQYLNNVSGVLFFNIGEVQINASREELKYSDSTKTAIVRKVESLIDEFVETSVSRLHALNISTFEKRIRFQILEKLKLPFKQDLELKKEYIPFKDIPPSFDITRKGREDFAEKFYVHRNARFVLKDDHRAMKGFYSLTDYDYFVRKKDDSKTWEEVEEELKTFLASLQLDGVPVIRLSTLMWTNPIASTGSRKTYNSNHRHTVFQLLPKDYYQAPFSRGWVKADAKEAQPTDVYVVLESFKVPGWRNFYDSYAGDSRMLKQFGIPVPTIYGYKTTDKKPIKTEDIVGTPYKQWAANLHSVLLTDKVKGFVEMHLLMKRNSNDNTAARLKEIVKILTPSHDVSVALTKRHEAELAWAKLDAQKQSAITTVWARYESHLKGLKSETEELKKRYPLLFLSSLDDTLDELFDKRNRDAWLEYVNLVDFVKNMKASAL